MDAEERLTADRRAVAGTCRRLAEAGLVPGTAGNVSLRRGDLVAVTASGTHLGAATEGEVVVVDMAGRLRRGDLRPTTELPLHLAIHSRRGEGAVIHTHAPLSTAVASTLDELPVVHYQLLALGGGVRVAPYSVFGGEQLAASVLEALEDRSAALMSNHGAVTLGPDLDSALEAALLLEWACGVHIACAALGRPRILDEAQQAEVRAALVAHRYGAPRPALPDL